MENYSEKYFEKVLKPILGKSGLFILGEINRYAEYCKLEERDRWEQQSLSNTHGSTYKELIEMAKDDGIA